MDIKRALLSTTAYANPADEAPDTSWLCQRAKDMEAMIPYWDKTDAIVEGYDAVRLAGEKYLPKFENESTEDYKTRQGLTKFTNIYRDVLEGLATKPFEEEITLIEPKNPNDGNTETATAAPEEIKMFCENVDGSGNNISSFAGLTFFNGINSAIDWIFIDYPTADPLVIRTVADQKAANIKPFWSHVLGRNVLEARSHVVGNKEVLSYIRILEPAITDVERIREFTKTGDVVSWILWEKNPKYISGNKDMYLKVDEGVLSIKVIPFVPFITGRRDGKSFKLYPVMRDAADLQISLYQDESALQFIKTMAGYPMLAANGMKPPMDATGKTPLKLAVGPMKVLYGAPDGNGNSGTWNYIEPSATSMKFLQDSIVLTKQDLRELGRQPLTATTGQLTVITTAVAANKARSAVSAWALMLKQALEQALTITALWMNIQYVPQVNVFTEFDSVTEGNADLTELGAARERGDLSRETYWSELKRRKVLAPEFSAKVEEERLLNEIPSEPIMPTTTPKNPTGKN